MKLTRFNQLADETETLKGHWDLNRNHEVIYQKTRKAESAALKASLIAAEPDTLVVALTGKKSAHRVVTTLLKLTGAWRLDEKNRITFEVEKESGKKDVLTFQGVWHVNRQHQVVYTYERQALKRKTKKLETLVFKGTWDLTDDHELTYTLGVDSESHFRFRGTFETKSLSAKAGEIRYQVGVEVKGKERIRTIALFGKWKLSRDLGLGFEIEYEDGIRKAIAFQGEYRLTENLEAAVELKSRAGKPLGLELTLTKEFLDNKGRAFVRLKKTFEESALEAGVTLPW